MVAASTDAHKNHHFVIRPNRSLSWRQTKLCYLAIACYSLSVAGAFTLMGFWPVLPFAGAELVALGLGMYVCSRRCHLKEVVSVRADAVDVEKGIVRPDRRWSFARTWARVHLLPPAYRRHRSRLVIRSHGREVEIGAFLNESERRGLERDLNRALETAVTA